jgi:hypothetical protein
LLLIAERRNTDRPAHAFAHYGALLPRRVLLGYAGVGGFGRLGESARGGAGRQRPAAAGRDHRGTGVPLVVTAWTWLRRPSRPCAPLFVFVSAAGFDPDRIRSISRLGNGQSFGDYAVDIARG